MIPGTPTSRQANEITRIDARYGVNAWWLTRTGNVIVDIHAGQLTLNPDGRIIERLLPLALPKNIAGAADLMRAA